MTPAVFAALALFARTVAADRGNVALELTGGAHMKRVKAHRAHEIAAVRDQIRELQQRVDELEVRELQEGRPIVTNVDYGSSGTPGDKPPADSTAKPTADAQTDGGPADATATQSGPSERSELPKADALRELLDESNGPVVVSMNAADESAATLLDSAKQWKQSGEDIKKEFEESVQKEVVQTGKTLEEEHGGVKQEADEKPKTVLEELKQKHAASAPGGAGNSNSAASALEMGPPCRRGRVDWVVRPGGNGVRRAVIQQFVDSVKAQFTASGGTVQSEEISGTENAVNRLRIVADAEGTAGGIHAVVEAVQSHWEQIAAGFGDVVEACL